MLCYQCGRARHVKSVTAAQTVGTRQSSAVMTVVLASASLRQRSEDEGQCIGSMTSLERDSQESRPTPAARSGVSHAKKDFE